MTGSTLKVEYNLKIIPLLCSTRFFHLYNNRTDFIFKRQKVYLPSNVKWIQNVTSLILYLVINVDII